ncbi:hypothetical protein BDV95DRAFT_656318 [Massariosphaeria phaeospora]|uniref:Galactose oxidase n=1 Tax=Massariosphaeria phaeospora TaxID=100035 RepID=A0A7C8ICQ7_9PLEO|nr:hypothetical protein BDV95DRAFT_656318 [Massariosphaeria phaeospora]
MNHINAAVSNGKLYVLGGLADDTSGPIVAWRRNSSSWVYDPATNIWAPIAPLPNGTARGSAAVGVHARTGTIVLAGGMTDLELAPGGRQRSVATVSMYDTATNTWRAAPDLPAPRDHAGGAVVGHHMYVLGGRADGQANVRDTVFILDLNDIEQGWRTSKARMPTPRGGVAVGVVGSRVYTFGGEGNAEVESGVFADVEAYDVERDGWEKLGDMRVPRHGTSAVGVRGRVYVPGGGVRQGAGAVAGFDVFLPKGGR